VSEKSFSPHPWFDGAAAYEVEWLPEDSDSAVLRTMERMGELVRHGARLPEVERAAGPLRRRSRRDTYDAVFHWVKDRVRFVRDSELASHLSGLADPDGAEVLIPPADLLRMVEPRGDCDDFSMAGAALLESLGLPWSFRVIAADGGRPDQFSHIYLAGELESGEPYPLDISHGDAPGLELENRYDKRGAWGLGMRLGEAPWWQTAIEGAVKTTSNILTSRYGHAPTGTFIQTPEGGVYSRGGVPTGAVISPGGVSSFGGSTIALLGIGVVLVFAMMSRGRR
jgi:hypothetical protein